jgi:hypothetical protein
MKQYTLEDIRALKGLPNGVLQTKFGEIDNALASSYLNKLIVRTQVRSIKEKKDYPIISEFIFIQEQMELMELQAFQEQVQPQVQMVQMELME